VSVPVLLIIFNRPEMTRRALEAISRSKPKTLLVAADGARFPEEAERCDQARELVKSVDWECDIRTNFSDINLGCGIRVYTAIDWAMSQFEELIVIEDDCVPAKSFFMFCEEMLAYYRNDERVMHIAGNNFQFGNNKAPYSYYFSKYFHVASFATWRRAWKHFDWRINQWPALKESGMVQSLCSDPHEQQYWTKVFDSVYGGRQDIWDYQWTLSCWAQNGLAIIPNLNLVTNIGVGPDATHTKEAIPLLNLPSAEMSDIEHPPFMVRNHVADEYAFLNNYGGRRMREAAAWPARLKQKLIPVGLPIRAARKLWRMASSQST
jgi:hypothetical protein